MKAELARRDSYTAAVRDFFLSRPGVWIPVRVLADVGGFSGWRTRVSEQRRAWEAAGVGTITWNKSNTAPAYRYEPRVPVPQPTHQPSLFAS